MEKAGKRRGGDTFDGDLGATHRRSEELKVSGREGVASAAVFARHVDDDEGCWVRFDGCVGQVAVSGVGQGSRALLYMGTVMEKVEGKAFRT